MKNLIKKYPNLDPNNIREKDIIYFCRDALSFYSVGKNAEKKKEFEKEILEVIQSKEWDWSAQDIDRNTILTYPIYNNAYSIVAYLLDNNKYDISEYKKETSDSLCACITLVSDKMFPFIIERENLNIKYKDDMVIRCYAFASSVSDENNKKNYLEKASTLLKNGVSFEPVINDFIYNTQNYEERISIFSHFLDNHPLDINEKMNILKDNLNQLTLKKSNASKENGAIIEKWMTYHSLNNELAESNIPNKRPKI